MMKKQIVAVVFAVSIVGGVGAGVLANAVTSDSPASASPDRTTNPTTPDGDAPVGGDPSTAPSPTAESLVIAPGAVGPVEVGMTKAEALATGLFVADVESPAEGCPVRPLAWKDEYVNTFDVQTVGNGEITSLGIRGEGVTTGDGLGIGSTLADVKASVADATPVEAGYGQSGVLQFDGQTGRWIGYLFDAPLTDLSDDSPVTFIEVTKGGQPSLMRDGC